ETLMFQDEHQRILSACLANDPAAARDSTVEHLLSAGHILKNYLTQR
ncbi:MAG TPA: GntR family transcriptional regulator, partial [Erwinia persicina]|nr:GntR family transcriptional regulator [Erwinia persicina]HBH69067.1 GntR family transcriptional regulator [Erwinia persicina]HBT14998.1 GntR family transcriptional regulator [Erwinia persicina]